MRQYRSASTHYNILSVQEQKTNSDRQNQAFTSLSKHKEAGRFRELSPAETSRTACLNLNNWQKRAETLTTQRV